MARTYRLGGTRKLINAIARALIARGVPIAGKTGFLLTTTGRKSGLDRTTPVNVVEVGGERWLVSPYGTVGWVHNLRASGVARLRRGGNRQAWEVEEVDAARAAPVLRHYVGRLRITAPFFDAAPSAAVEEFAAEADQHPVFRLARPHA